MRKTLSSQPFLSSPFLRPPCSPTAWWKRSSPASTTTSSTRAELARNRQQLQDEAKQKGAPLSNEQMAAREKDLLRDLIDQPTPDPKSQRPWYQPGTRKW